MLLSLLQLQLLLIATVLLPSLFPGRALSAAAAASLGRLFCKLLFDRCLARRSKFLLKVRSEETWTEAQLVGAALLITSERSSLVRQALAAWLENAQAKRRLEPPATEPPATPSHPPILKPLLATLLFSSRVAREYAGQKPPRASSLEPLLASHP